MDFQIDKEDNTQIHCEMTTSEFIDVFNCIEVMVYARK
jgi:hypothetical protein